jgi:class 3 adenylate cyclase
MPLEPGVQGVDRLLLRDYRDADWPAVCAVHDRARPDELRDSCDPRAFVPLAEEQEDAESFQRSRKFVACVGDQIVGFVGIDGTYLSWLYVDPSYHRQGIGRRLLRLGVQFIGPHAWTVALAGNTRARRLYESEGFQVVDTFDSANAGYPCICVRLALSPLLQRSASMSELPGGTLTVLHTDIEASTSLTMHLGNRYPEVLAIHSALLRAVFAAHEGREVDTQGDAFFVVFPRASQAVAAAVAIQRALVAAVWPEGGAVRVRIGLHTGEPIRTAEGYTGLDIIRGARIRDAGHGGQVLLSKSTAALVEDALIDGLRLWDLGAHRLKGLPRPERIFQLIIPDLPADFPPLQSLETAFRVE